MSKIKPILVLGAACALAACSGTTPGTSQSVDGLTEQMAAVALEADYLSEEVVQMELAAMTAPPANAPPGGGPIVDQKTFSRTLPCPAGGEMSAAGSIDRTWDPATRTLEAAITGDRSRTDCGFMIEGNVITVNGSSMSEHDRRWVGGMPDGLQTSHYMGSWHAVSTTGEERQCSFEYTVVRDPATMTRTVDGNTCSRRVHRSTSWNPS